MSPGKDMRKVVRMSEACVIIPYESADENTFLGESDVPCEEKQETPDYIRRAAIHHQITPVKLFAADDNAGSNNHLFPRLTSEYATTVASYKDGVAPETKTSSLCTNAGSNNGMEDDPQVDSLSLQAREMDERTLKEEDGCISCHRLKIQCEIILKDQEKSKMLLEQLKREYELKSEECNAAVMSLKELRAELMRKSMHVGSLAFAVEGQVKEKSRWFQSITDLSEKLKVLKLKQGNLLEETKQYTAACLTDISQTNASVREAIKECSTMRMEYDELKVRYANELKERKDLYNKLIELKGNIRVFCRCRPLNIAEESEEAAVCVDFENAKEGEIVVKGHLSTKKIFKFDSVFCPEENQEAVFDKTAPFATSVLDGYNVCIFAYGQTGTGKTFTMEGTETNRGVNYRTLEEMFRIIKQRNDLYRYEVTVSVLEVYNEQIHDLLSTESIVGTNSKRLEVRQVSGVHHVPGITEAHVSNMNEAWKVLQTGAQARSVGSTNANEHSSRSHCMHCVMVKGENLVTGECTKSKLWLIDLAGSERVAKTDAQGERLKEAQNINKSLSALADVISALATKSNHIPFRNSKLTHLLQDSLSGDSKTLMFVQISPNENDVGETLSSLNFASRVRGIELGAARKQVDAGELSRYKLMIRKAKQESKSKDAQVKSMEDAMHMLETKNNGLELIVGNLQEKVKELESQLLVERRLARQHVDTKIAQDHLQLQSEPSTSETPLQDESSGPLADITIGRPLPSTPNTKFLRQILSIGDKENKPELAEEPLSQMARRVSLCNAAGQLPAKARRISLCNVAGQLPPKARRISICNPVFQNPINLPPWQNSFVRPAGVPHTRLAENASPCHSPLPGPARSKKISSILRRSLQKKVIVRPPLPPSSRRGDITQGVEKFGSSVANGSRRKARRVPLNNTRDESRAPQQLQPRAWVHSTSSKPLH